MEAATASIPTIALPEDIVDSMGSPLSTGDRVKVVNSSRFGEGEGHVIGYVRLAPQGPEDAKLVEGELQTKPLGGSKSIRIRVLMDNGTDGDEYSASQGRVTKLDTENGSEAEDGDPAEG